MQNLGHSSFYKLQKVMKLGLLRESKDLIFWYSTEAGRSIHFFYFIFNIDYILRKLI